jgi:transcriptional regulator with XRE-family HTH domain
MCSGRSPITVWREKRGLTLTGLAGAVGLRESDLAAIESGGAVDSLMSDKIADAPDVLPGMLAAVKACPPG